MSITNEKVKVKSFTEFRVARPTSDGFIKEFLQSIGTPRALTVYLLYSSKSKEDHDQLSKLECRPEFYLDGFQFRDDYAATSFLSKSAFLDTTFDKKEVALKKFWQYEELCRSTNNRFKNLALDPLYTGSNVWLLHATKCKIANILGDFKSEEFFDSANWGPGVTTRLKGCYVSAINKFHLENGITPHLHSLVGELFSVAYPVWDSHLSYLYGSEKWSFQAGNTVVTVPKNSKTDRVIAVEPGINLWFQKSVGSMIRRRLLRSSIDLNTQSRNQELAMRGSKDQLTATIDFSSASDSISLNLIRELLPSDWLQVMDSCRSKFGILDHKPHWWEKFSSMGNGFTFELESLIFFAAALAVKEYQDDEGPISVYGDDVVLPRSCLGLYSSFCDFLGFRVNSEKSYSTGYFRESCGSHYWDGIDCKPIFLKERVSNVQAIYKLANSVRLLANRRNSYYGCDRKFLSCWRSLFTGVPKSLRLRVSAQLGDVGFICNFDESAPSSARRRYHGVEGLEGYRCRALVAVGQTDYLDSTAVLLARLWSPSIQEFGNSYTLRGRVRYRLTTVLVPRWCDLGPWW